MKFLNLISIAILALALTACSGHGHEGDYTASVEGSMGSNPFGSEQITIGSDYVESNGQRQQLEEIVVRESNGQKYLVLKGEGGEESFRIEDDGTLVQDLGFARLVLSKK